MNHTKRLLVLCTLFLMVAQGYSQTTTKAEVPQATEKLNIRTITDPSVLNRLGDDYLKQENIEKALECYQEAAKTGDPTGQFNMARLYENGVGVPQDLLKAIRTYRLLAKEGHLDSVNALAFLFETGKGLPQDYDQALKLYQQAADKGHARSQYNIGHMYDRYVP